MFGSGKQRLQSIEEALAAAVDPATGLSLSDTAARVEARLLQDGMVSVDVRLGYPSGGSGGLSAAVGAIVQANGYTAGAIQLGHRIQSHAPQPNVPPVAGTKAAKNMTITANSSG